jgi:hypothetical protein
MPAVAAHTSYGNTLKRVKKPGASTGLQAAVCEKRSFAIPRQGGGRWDLRQRFEEVFKEAKRDGTPFGNLTEVELRCVPLRIIATAFVFVE